MSLRGSWNFLGGQNRKPRRGNPFFGSILGPSWRALGAILGSSWLPKESQERPKSDPKIDQNLIPCWDHLLGGFGRFWGAKQSQVGSKIKTKSMLISKNGFIQKASFSLRKNHDFHGSGCPRWASKTKTRQNRTRQDRTGQDRSKRVWILVDF